jgi:hypothetical protein
MLRHTVDIAHILGRSPGAHMNRYRSITTPAGWLVDVANCARLTAELNRAARIVSESPQAHSNDRAIEA